MLRYGKSYIYMNIPDALATFIIYECSRNVAKYIKSYYSTYYISKIYTKVFIENKILFSIFSYIR